MLLYALSIFIGAFLLFLVQPMMAQFILPWFGGSSLVWTTCMLFFQTGLVFGYAYAHGLTQKLEPRTQWMVHVILVSAAVLCLPIRPGFEWKPVDGQWPTWRVLWLLLMNVGLPYAILATTGPLIQRWQSLSHPTNSPYRLFALSNLGSLLALLAFPFVLENLFTLDSQSWAWSGGFLLYAVLVVGCGYRFQLMVSANSAPEIHGTNLPTSAAQISNISIPGVTIWQQLTWFVLPMLASIQLLATTNFLTQEVGAHPFLWILPLALYLLSFIISFEYERLYVRPVFFVGLCATSLLACWAIREGLKVGFLTQLLAYSGVLFTAAMICHGELARRKPAPRHLTIYYLWISVGGAAGGVFVALLAPLFFRDYYEFHLSLLLVVGITFPAIVAEAYRHYRRLPTSKWKMAASWFTITGGVVAACGVATSGFQLLRDNSHVEVVAIFRNEYGVVKVQDSEWARTLRHGQTKHGLQFKDEDWRLRPTSYYNPRSGMGLAIRFLQGGLEADDSVFPYTNRASMATKPGIRMGVIGLGTGTVATWARENDEVTFFEIDPKVELVARDYFTYLRDCLGIWTITPGDARIQLEHEKQNEQSRYDLLVVDAFSSDSIPKHLLTKEALQIYLERTSSDGIVAIHVSNRFLQLAPLLERQAADLDVPAIHVSYDPNRDSEEALYYDSSSWVLLTSNQEFILHPVVQSAAGPFPAQDTNLLWTDDFTPLVPLLK